MPRSQQVQHFVAGSRAANFLQEEERGDEGDHAADHEERNRPVPPHADTDLHQPDQHQRHHQREGEPAGQRGLLRRLEQLSLDQAALNLFDDTVTRRRLEALFAGFARELRADTGALAGEAVAQELAMAGAC